MLDQKLGHLAQQLIRFSLRHALAAFSATRRHVFAALIKLRRSNDSTERFSALAIAQSAENVGRSSRVFKRTNGSCS
jgi:hypothetical protein